MHKAAVLCLLAFGCGKPAPKGPPPAREVTVLTLVPSEVRDTSEYLGSLLSRQSVTLLPQVGGYVRKILVRPGEAVESDHVLLEVDARQEAAALESAQAQAHSAGSSQELARQTLSRTQALYKEGLVSAQELERAAAAVAAAEATRRSASAQVSQRRVQLQYYGVRAPFAGTVGDVLVKVGDFVSPTTPLTTIAQADVLEVSVAVPAERARQVKPELPVELLDREGRVVLRCNVYFVAPQADPRTQLVDVKAVFRNLAGLRPSEVVRTRLVYGTRQALQVPPLAVVRQSGQPFVYAVEQRDGKTVVSRRPVTLGPLNESSYVVEKGLSAGDRIAVSSLQALRDGAVIQPRAAEAKQAEKQEAAPQGRGGER